MDRALTASKSWANWCSPHTRGWTVSIWGNAADPAVFPAYAGMDRRISPGLARNRTCSPHTRGWTVRGKLITTGWVKCSPHTRGWTERELDSQAWPGGVPRIRGDGPQPGGMDQCPHPCSPHTRGWTGRPDPLLRGVGSVPRIRGDGPQQGLEGSAADAVFPAYAGMDRPPNDGRIMQLSVFPAYAGMDRLSATAYNVTLLCSPHTRGWTGGLDPSENAVGVFPAYAGMDRPVRRHHAGRFSCSPHTRGWTVVPQSALFGAEGVPRIRGDGPSCFATS